MCGIVGYVGGAGQGRLASMLARLEHRGPDDHGLHEEPDAGLGATRLAIIDVAGGHQPIANEDESLWIVFNGEVYNHRALRPDLEARGHRFRTRSDTEVVLHLFEETAERCVDQLRGMFAFAIWDARRRRLVVARDRLGKKPLYYWHRDGLFLFASEVKALLAHPAVRREVDWDALHHYLAFGYTPADHSIFAGIAKLPPAHTAVLDAGTLGLHRYWALPPGPPAGGPAPSGDELAEQVREELREAVRLRLESDVPVGVFLSGGIDSSAVVASMREVSGGRIATFSIGFGGVAPGYDELAYARQVARRFETDHHEELLEAKVDELLGPIVAQFDEPFADSSAVPTYVIAQATGHHVKVVLSGIGGDETFGGYPRHLGVRVSELYRRAPRWLRSAPETALLGILPESDASPDWGGRLRRFLDGADRPLPERYIGWTRFFSEADLGGLATPALPARWTGDADAAHRAAFAGYGHGDPVDGAARIDLSTYLPDDLLVMADRMSMAHSLELRAPFCDHRLVETSLAIPPSRKIPGFRLKGLLKKPFAGVLPAEIVSRRKQGFMIPLAAWLRSDLRPVVDDLLHPDRVRARGLFDPARVGALRAEHAAGRRSHADRLWTLMVLEVWIREYLDRGGTWTAS